jgi:hypothetical protein
MNARLTSTGIRFGDNTLLESKYGIVPKNSVSVFLQSSAPLYWIKSSLSTTHNNKTLRVVSGTGGGFGSGGISGPGGLNFTSAFPISIKTISVSNIPVSGTVGNHTLTISQLPSHVHGNGGAIGLSRNPAGGDVGAGAGWTRTFPGWSAQPAENGSGGAHAHPWSGSLNFLTSLDFRVQYVDLIICSFS